MSTLLVQKEEPPQSRYGLWDCISSTRLNLWLKCPLAFKLRYVDGIKFPTPPSFFLGKCVHDALEVFYRHRQLGADFSIEDTANRIRDGWEEMVEAESVNFASAEQADGLQQQAIGLVTVYLQHVADASEIPIAVETNMEAPLVDPETGEHLGLSLIGVVDVIFDDCDGPLICDFKTASKSSAPSEVAHEIQLSSYAYLFRQGTGDEEGGLEIRSLIKTKTPKIEFHRYRARSDVHFRRLFSVIRAYLDDLDAGRFVFRPGFNCSMCNYRDDSCRHWDGRGEIGAVPNRSCVDPGLQFA